MSKDTKRYMVATVLCALATIISVVEDKRR
jgi:hypothetical protein